jgi:hypothetical protein
MKARTAIKLLVLLALVFLVLPAALLAAHGDKKPMKKGILLVFPKPKFRTTTLSAQ